MTCFSVPRTVPGLFRRAVPFGISLWLAACASVLTDAEQLSRAGQHEQALSLLSQASADRPGDPTLRAALARQRELVITELAMRADVARSAGRSDDGAVLLRRLEVIDAGHPRVRALRVEVERQRRIDQSLQAARQAQREGRSDEVREALRSVLIEAPGHPAARRMLAALNQARKPAPLPHGLGEKYQKPVTLEFREAPLRSVLEGLARTTGVNFVFDKDVRGDAKVSIYLRDVSVDEALRVILSTQQLERKLLNDSTVLIYPATQAKQREHQELVTRSFYLTNADAKQAQALVRTLAKTRDLYVDDRLNLLVVRDTPEVLRLVERLIAGMDLADPEVVLEVEVVEIASGRLDELGIAWPDQVQFGLLGSDGSGNLGTSVTRLTSTEGLRASILNPALSATLRETLSRGNTLANPRLRARNREKAKIVVGEKLPVFTTTTTPSGGATPTIAATVTYLDIGLKLDVEPSVQLDNDVVMKVNLEVTTLIGKVLGPQGSVAYQVGTRQATTSLRLRDGETQVLAGLIREEDSKAVTGLPGLAGLPLVGRLFGVHSDQRSKSEVVLLITPRVVRNLELPEAELRDGPSGIDASPGAESIRLGMRAAVQAPMAGASVAAPGAAPAAAAQATPNHALLQVSSGAPIAPGGTGAVTLRNQSGIEIGGQLLFDANQLQPAQAGGAAPGSLPFVLGPGAERVFMLRALPAAAGQRLELSLSVEAPSNPDAEIEVRGEAVVEVQRR